MSTHNNECHELFIYLWLQKYLFDVVVLSCISESKNELSYDLLSHMFSLKHMGDTFCRTAMGDSIN